MSSTFPLDPEVNDTFQGYFWDGEFWKKQGQDLNVEDFVTIDNLPTAILGIDTVLDGGTAFAEVVLTIDGGIS
jgi:hypothetical protein